MTAGKITSSSFCVLAVKCELSTFAIAHTKFLACLYIYFSCMHTHILLYFCWI